MDEQYSLDNELPSSIDKIQEELIFWNLRKGSGAPDSYYEIRVAGRIRALEVKREQLRGSESKPNVEVDENYVFVLMPLIDEMDAIYRDTIKPSIESLGFQCERADDIFSASRVMDDIIGSINKAVLIIADLTGKNPNVFYEIGYGHCLGKRVIFLAQNINEVPFDIKHWRIIRYENSETGRVGLGESIRRTINNELVGENADKGNI